MTGKDSTVLPKNNRSKLKTMIEKNYEFLAKMDRF
jgi:hypothetical protein